MTPYNYAASSTDAATVISSLNERSNLHRAHIAEVFDLCSRGERYSHESGDIISAAVAELRKNDPFRVVREYEKGWVASRNKQTIHINMAKEWAFKTLAERQQ